MSDNIQETKMHINATAREVIGFLTSEVTFWTQVAVRAERVASFLNFYVAPDNVPLRAQVTDLEENCILTFWLNNSGYQHSLDFVLKKLKKEWPELRLM